MSVQQRERTIDDDGEIHVGAVDDDDNDDSNDSDDPYSVYLCGPVQNVTTEQAHTWRDEIIEEHDAIGIEWVNPLDEYSDVDNVIHESNGVMDDDIDGMATAQSIVDHCYSELHRCDALFARYQDVASVGTAMEIKEADDLNQTVVVWFDCDMRVVDTPAFLSTHSDHFYLHKAPAIETIGRYAQLW